MSWVVCGVRQNKKIMQFFVLYRGNQLFVFVLACINSKQFRRKMCANNGNSSTITNKTNNNIRIIDVSIWSQVRSIRIGTCRKKKLDKAIQTSVSSKTNAKFQSSLWKKTHRTEYKRRKKHSQDSGGGGGGNKSCRGIGIGIIRTPLTTAAAAAIIITRKYIGSECTVK